MTRQNRRRWYEKDCCLPCTDQSVDLRGLRYRQEEGTKKRLAHQRVYAAASGGGRRLGRRAAWYADLSAQDEASEVYRRRTADSARADRTCGMVGFALKNCEKIYIILIL